MNKLKDKQTDRIISFNLNKLNLHSDKITNFQENIVKKYYRLSLIYQQYNKEDKEIILECTGSVRIFAVTLNFQSLWIPANKLNKDDQIGGIDPQTKNFIFYKINTIE